MRRASAFLLLSSAACATSVAVSSEELAMSSHPLAGEAGAVILDRDAAVILDYSEAPTVDYTGGARETVKAIQESGSTVPGASSDLISPEVADLFSKAGVASFSLEVMQRCKILSEAGLRCARIAERLPPGSEIDSVEGTTFLPAGTTVALDASQVQVVDDIIRFEIPGATVGSVVTFRYKVFSRELGVLGWVFDGPLPIAQTTYKMKVRTDSPFPFRFRPADETRTVTPKRKKVAGKNVGGLNEWIIWSLTDLPAITDAKADKTVLVFGD